MPGYESEYENYYCDKINANVNITRTYKIHRSSRSAKDAPIKKDLGPTDCDSASEACGVLDRKDNIHWSKCAHPVLKKLGS